MEDFLTEGPDPWVNLPAQTMEHIKNVKNKAPPDVFDVAQNQVVRLLRMPFNEFTVSKHYEDYNNAVAPTTGALSPRVYIKKNLFAP